ncbi:MAG: hypothetical protein A2493_01290 [Candidatus Magasanikbacteria bacterium RIFOXYC12_FULL_33_11]|uniref:Uncharacterized protein n=1 Tax=Candidatus Magasanikbacteria bacterium RIFOXYC12_FULL_33_11 TaxID=1798701 RepID=A0A1F6NM98_9BACT|nr:MAG: hypothetical protein A2493_01290 [Candidatus Magasanikbacteria bacterium RIFOXYC12_FULL_33_11]
MHSFFCKTILKKPKTNYTYNRKGRKDFSKKFLKSFYVDACHVKTYRCHKKFIWCAPWSRQKMTLINL